jgi:hypothetical protein
MTTSILWATATKAFFLPGRFTQRLKHAVTSQGFRERAHSAQAYRRSSLRERALPSPPITTEGQVSSERRLSPTRGDIIKPGGVSPRIQSPLRSIFSPSDRRPRHA